LVLTEKTLRFQRVINKSRDAFVEVDARYAITEWSASAEELLGWPKDQMIGRSILEIMGEQSVDLVDQGLTVLRSMTHSDGQRQTLVDTEFPPMFLSVRLRAGTYQTFSCLAFVTSATKDEARLGVYVYPTADASTSVPASEMDRLHDSLTGFPNRTLFTRRLGVALGDLASQSGTVAVACINVNRFKSINDALGHDMGDEVLMEIAARLRLVGDHYRPMLSRLGGDEFLALFEDADQESVVLAEEFAEKATEALQVPFNVGDREIFLAVSIGIASTNDPQMRASTLLSNADAAMHESKTPQGQGKRVFGETLRTKLVDRMSTEHSLHRALDRQELALFYQPVVDISGNSAVGVEALIRWHHPERGLVAPDRFIPVAEESGLIIPIGAWVIEEACRQLTDWRSDDGHKMRGTMEVNLSARQIDHPAIVSTVESILAATGLPPEHLTLEITESALMRDAVAAMHVLQALKDIGVSLAIDDFGTGYSSLSYLQKFPLDVLKVDKSFVDELGDSRGAEIVSSIINLAHALGLSVVAEGVETQEQLGMLQELHCDLAQGYLFSRPVPASELAAAVAFSH
jgi:diguanylate cyclase (GGDEF)-like protein